MKNYLLLLITFILIFSCFKNNKTKYIVEENIIENKTEITDDNSYAINSNNIDEEFSSLIQFRTDNFWNEALQHNSEVGFIPKNLSTTKLYITKSDIPCYSHPNNFHKKSFLIKSGTLGYLIEENAEDTNWKMMQFLSPNIPIDNIWVNTEMDDSNELVLPSYFLCMARINLEINNFKKAIDNYKLSIENDSDNSYLTSISKEELNNLSNIYNNIYNQNISNYNEISIEEPFDFITNFKIFKSYKTIHSVTTFINSFVRNNDNFFVSCHLQQGAGNSIDNFHYFLKINSSGNLIYEMEIEGNPEFFINTTPNNDIFCISSYYDQTSLAKLDLTFNEKWKYNIKEKYLNSEKPSDITLPLQCNDKNYFFAIRSHPSEENLIKNSINIIKINNNGELILKKTISNEMYLQIIKLIKGNNKYFLVLNNDDKDFYKIIVFDFDGNILDERNLDEIYKIEDIINTYDDGLLVLINDYNEKRNKYIKIVKFDKYFNIESIKIIDTINRDYGDCIKKTNDNGYVLLGEIYNAHYRPTNLSNIILIKFDKDFNEEWRKLYKSYPRVISEDILQGSNNNFNVIMKTSGYSDLNIYLSKLDSEGNLIN